ncbi:putative DNA-3-methyladenine glycosylase [Phyllosticta citriasiana]|uniref:putative DNA-3-methyladenine glycosylase n=1 Tax=Phyllosticta citriasiana TaxID=595635 RepID=UPI0030FD4E08
MSTLIRRSARLQSRATSEPVPKAVNGKVGIATDTSKATKSRAKKAKSTEPNRDQAAAVTAKDTTKTSKKRGRPAKQKTESPAAHDEAESAMPPPQTPVLKRRKVEVDSHSSTAAPRPAKPHASNAPLTTPGGSRVTYLRKVPAQEEQVSFEAQPTLTTETLLKEAEAHLIKIDPGLKPLIEKNPCKMFSPEGLQEEVEPFRALISSIMAQQVSGAAARSIKNRFIALFAPPSAPENFFPTPAMVSIATVPHLRTAGLSARKAEYTIGIAQKFVSGELSASKLATATDAELLEMLIQVRGLGRWSVEMFSVFTLKRMDVFSTGDLGVQRGMAAWQKRDVESLKRKAGQLAKDGKTRTKGGLDGKKWKYMTEQEMLDFSEPFKPYRSLFMWYMWRIEDTDVDALQDN